MADPLKTRVLKTLTTDLAAKNISLSEEELQREHYRLATLAHEQIMSAIEGSHSTQTD